MTKETQQAPSYVDQANNQADPSQGPRVNRPKEFLHSTYSRCPNASVQSADLSSQAKDIFHFMVSLPDDWIIYKLWVRAQYDKHHVTGEKPKNYMCDRVFNRAWKELQDEGFLVKEKSRKERGRFSGCDWSFALPDTPRRTFNRIAPNGQKADQKKEKSTESADYASSVKAKEKPEENQLLPPKVQITHVASNAPHTNDSGLTNNSSSSHNSRVRAREVNAQAHPHCCTPENQFFPNPGWVELVLENACSTIESCAEGWYPKIRHDLKAKIQEYWENYALPGQVPSKADAEDYARKGVNHRYSIQGLDVVRWGFDDGCPF